MIFPPKKWLFLKTTIIGYCLLACFSSCGKKDCREDEGSIPASGPLQIIRLEDSLNALQDREETRNLLLRHPLFSEKYLRWSALPQDSILVNDVWKIAKSPFNDTLRMDVKKEFANLSWLRSGLESLFDHTRFYYPEVINPTVYTLTAGYGVDMEVKDSVIVLGLEYFLSDSSHYIPRDPVSGVVIPGYIRKRLKKRFILPSIAMVVADRFCETDVLDNSMLGEMLKWGRIYYFMEKTMPCMPDSLIAGYSGEELNEVNGNLKAIWAHYSENKLFFNTDLFLIRKYCDERPNVLEIGDQCPGRIGRWLGWQIVRKWAIDNKIPLKQVMSEKDARKIFSESGFRP
jgi:hypothetical protein